MFEDSAAVFRTTRWTLLDALHSGGEDRDRAATRLAEVYWPAVYAYLRRKGRNREEAAELTQAFFADVVVSRGLFDRASAERGRLRGLLIAALKNFIIDLHRAKGTRRCETPPSSQLIEIAEASLDSDPSVAADEAFKRAWATAHIREAAERGEAHFRRRGKENHWRAFEAHVLSPAVRGTRPVMYIALAEELGFRTDADVRAAVQVVKKRMLNILEQLVAEEDGVGESARDVLAALGVAQGGS